MGSPSQAPSALSSSLGQVALAGSTRKPPTERDSQESIATELWPAHSNARQDHVLPGGFNVTRSLEHHVRKCGRSLFASRHRVHCGSATMDSFQRLRPEAPHHRRDCEKRLIRRTTFLEVGTSTNGRHLGRLPAAGRLSRRLAGTFSIADYRHLDRSKHKISRAAAS
jgi:hypothetical protein